MMIIIIMKMMIGDDDDNDEDDDPHPSLQLIDLYISSIGTNSSRCLCHVLSIVGSSYNRTTNSHLHCY